MDGPREIHLLPHERRIWRKFWADPPFPIESVLFDLHLGLGTPVDPEWPIAIQKMATTLTQKRVDVVLRSGTDVWIVEIKRRAGLSALGQLLGYAAMFDDEYAPGEVPRLAVVAEGVMPDVTSVLSRFGISLFLV